MEGSPRRISSASASASASSPEFQFWAVFDPPPPLLTADELFADGVLLPLHHLSLRPHLDAETDAPPGRPKSKPEPGPASPAPRPPPAAELTASISCSPTTGSKRWKEIFRVGEKKPAEEKERRKDRKGGDGGAVAVAVAELNINIWPFSRSRSAGSAARPPASASGRRVSSAPCSRSNSRGESSKHHHASAAPSARRWAASPGRPGGVMVGRASPVWQIRRPEHRERDKVTAGGRKTNAGAAARVMNTSIGYRGGQRSCRGDDKDGVTASERTGRGLFSLMTLFSKKVH